MILALLAVSIADAFGLEETWTSSHTYSFDTVAAGEFPAAQVEGAITWAYDGQQHFHAEGSPNCEEKDEELQALDIRHYGSPQWEDVDNDPPANCVSGSTSSTYTNTVGDSSSTFFTIFDSGASSEVTSTVLGAEIDAGAGQSGGPMYVWEGSVPTHVGVLKGWHVLPAYNGGPRTSAFRSWVISTTCVSC